MDDRSHVLVLKNLMWWPCHGIGVDRQWKHLVEFIDYDELPSRLWMQTLLPPVLDTEVKTDEELDALEALEAMPDATTSSEQQVKAKSKRKRKRPT